MAFDYARPLSTIKYGLYVGLASIPANILIMIGYTIFFAIAGTAFDDGDFESGIATIAFGFMFMIIVQIVSILQIFCFAFNAAFCDSVPSYQSIGYFGSWKKAFSIFLELVYLIAVLILLTIISLVIMDSSPGLGLILLLVILIMWILTFMGLIPYTCRRMLEKDGNDAGSGNMGGSQLEPISQGDALEGLYSPGSDSNQ